MIQIILNDVTYSIIESSNGTNRTLINLLKNKIISYLLEDEEFYSKMKMSKGKLDFTSIIKLSEHIKNIRSVLRLLMFFIDHFK